MRFHYGFTSAVVASAFLFPPAIISALAHAQLRQATPAAGSTVSASPTEVLVIFTEPLEASFSSVVVRDAVGNRIDKADAHLDPKDHATMRVSVPQLNPGIYIVVWRALTSDTHRSDGAFIFRVEK